jgi:hypothetical protein
MNTTIVIALLLTFWAALATLLTRRSSVANDTVWDTYIDATDGVTNALGRAARPLAGSTIVKRAESTTSFSFLVQRLRMGGTFGGNLEIFFSVQLLTMLIGGAALSVVLLSDLPKFIEIALAGIGALLPIWPYNEANQKSLQRSRRITLELPDFAELLVMVLPSMSVPQALSFTAEHVSGEVSTEMRNLVRTLVTHTMSDDEAFSFTASRLGTAEGRQFVDALRDAHLEGTKVVESIKSQAESLRRISFQHRRAAAKQLPMRLTFIFALHFMPLLFALAFLPVVYGLGRAL